MTRFKGYKNAFTNNNRIFSMEDVLKMPMNEFFDREDELDSQDSLIGLPTNSELQSSPNVKYFESYTDNNGTRFPSKWESLNPLNNKIVPFSVNNTNYNRFKTDFANNAFPELEELLRKELEKIKKAYQPTQPVQTSNFEAKNNQIEPENLSLETEDKDSDIPKIEQQMNTENNNLLSQQINGLSQAFLSDKTNDVSREIFTPSEIFTHTEQNNIPISGIAGRITKPTDELDYIDSEQPQITNIDQNNIVPKDNTQEQVKEQSQISEQLRDYINDLVGENIDYNFIGNETTTSSQPDVPIYPENGVIKGGISNDYDSSKDILQQSEGYVYPDKQSRDYNLIDTEAIKFNNEKNKDRPDAKQMLEIGIYGVDSYDDNDQFKHIQDGSADIFNEKYNLTGSKTIPSDMKGIEFSKDSDFSKRISENEDFQQTVKDAIDKNGGNLPEKIELDFNKDSNLNYSIGHGTLLNAHKTDDGYIEGVVFDKYDYDYKYLNTPEATSYNTGAAGLHDLKRLEYYYYFVPVRFKY